MKPGGQMLFKGPIPKYQYQPNTFERGLCIAGGAGITPMYQLISHSLDLKDDKTKWTLVFSNVTEDDICECEGKKVGTDAECYGKSGISLPRKMPTG